MADNMSRGLNTEREITYAIKGLKAIKREAKETLQVLKELEKAKKVGERSE